jgi:hypothetical protein
MYLFHLIPRERFVPTMFACFIFYTGRLDINIYKFVLVFLLATAEVEFSAIGALDFHLGVEIVVITVWLVVVRVSYDVLALIMIEDGLSGLVFAEGRFEGTIELAVVRAVKILGLWGLRVTRAGHA